MLAAPALFPVIEYLDQSARVKEATRFMWRPSLDGLIFALGLPIYADVWRIWGGLYRLMASPPMYYLAWFAPVIIVNALVRRFEFRSTVDTSILWAICIVFAKSSVT